MREIIKCVNCDFKTEREIKFRVWIKPYYKFDKCKKEYRMLYPHLEKDEWYVVDCKTQTIMDGEGGRISDYPMYLQQFTGLKDKNGKEIYEGDVVINSNLGIKGYKNIGLNGNVVNIFDWANMRCLTEYINEDEREIIGNIFENPELIK